MFTQEIMINNKYCFNTLFYRLASVQEKRLPISSENNNKLAIQYMTNDYIFIICKAFKLLLSILVFKSVFSYYNYSIYSDILILYNFN